MIPKEEIMPVPTPRTIQPLTESDLHEDDHIPEDWKENNNNENEEVHSESKSFKKSELNLAFSSEICG